MPSTPSAPSDDALREIVAAHIHREGPLLPILHDIQEAYGYIPNSAEAVLADQLSLSKAEVHGVISFYHDFREKPAGRHVIKICRSEACQAMGVEPMAARVLAKLGLDWHGTSANGAVTVEPVYCLGLCATAPAAMVGDKLVGRLDDTRLEAMISEAGA